MEKIALSFVSIVVPIFNSEKTLKRCLDSIFLSVQDGDEVILVNDGSTDSSSKIMESYNCKKIDLGQNRGVAFARNSGAKISKNEIIIFIDSDIVISKENVEKLKKYFSENKLVQTVSCNIDCRKYMDDFYSNYKNLYMHYVLSGVGKEVSFVYGAFCATRSDCFFEWPEEFLLTEDSAWGYEQKLRGYEIHFIEDIQVMHIKKYSFFSLTLNDFKISKNFAINFLKYKRWKTLFTKDSFGHTSKAQILSLLIATLTTSLIFLSPKIILVIFAIWSMLNAKFFYYISKKSNFQFILKSIAWTYFDHHVYFLGITSGQIEYLRKNCKI